ncbi:centrosomal protein of 70 kDa [Scyliorhinus canicula]|uniref:centrosomal protein of 70 kDa n=1 Tax=Scyliorhinus canicula TaxID=7830 RepID=UPI0018F2B892|nr:centrosomal protein of 70 kDa [Scyliorhinus canicula]
MLLKEMPPVTYQLLCVWPTPAGNYGNFQPQPSERQEADALHRNINARHPDPVPPSGCVLALLASEGELRRLGGGRSLNGQQERTNPAVVVASLARQFIVLPSFVPSATFEILPCTPRSGTLTDIRKIKGSKYDPWRTPLQTFLQLFCLLCARTGRQKYSDGHKSIVLAVKRTNLLHSQSNNSEMSSTYRHLTVGVGKDNLKQDEQAEWDILNKLLQQHGFKPVQLADPQTNKRQRDVVVLERQSAMEIRMVVKILMKDTERRQTLICDLIQSNKELKNDLRQEQSKTSPKIQCIPNLEQVHDTVELKVQEVQGDYLAKCCQLKKQVEQLQHDKQDMQVQLHQLKQKLHEQKRTIVRLQKKLYMVVTEEEEHIERQNKVFLQFHKQAVGAQTIAKQQLLDIIDACEFQIHCLQKELSTQDNKIENVPEARKEPQGKNGKPKYSVLDEILKDKVLPYEDHLKDTKSRNRKYFQKNQNLKQVLKSFSGSGCWNGNDKEFMSIKVENMDCMQEATCKRLLKNICKEMGVIDVNDLLPAVRERSRLVAAYPKLQKGLYGSLKRLSELIRGKSMDVYDSSDEVRVEDLQLTVDAILDDLGNKHENTALKECKHASPQTPEGIVSHFQKLFDVSSLSGVYPRMNEIYSKLGEMSNAMKNLRHVLGLAESTPPSVLVNTIGKLCSTVNADTYRQVQQLLGTQEIDSIITKLEEHEEFFPAFYTVFRDLLQILEVDRMDRILPAVCALKLKTTKLTSDFKHF